MAYVMNITELKEQIMDNVAFLYLPTQEHVRTYEKRFKIVLSRTTDTTNRGNYTAILTFFSETTVRLFGTREPRGSPREALFEFLRDLADRVAARVAEMDPQAELPPYSEGTSKRFVSGYTN